jgi:hypothetical protein
MPKAGHTKHNIHWSMDDAWVLRAFKEIMGEEIPKRLEGMFLEQFKDLLLNSVTTEEFLKEIFEELKENSIVFKYRGDL